MKVVTKAMAAVLVAAAVGGAWRSARADEVPPGGVTSHGVAPVESALAHVRCRCPEWSRAHLLERLRAARARQVAALRAYLEAGKFPAEVVVALPDDEEPRMRPAVERFEARFEAQDPHAAEGRRHTFIGANGALCAVAHLIAADGQRPLVDRLAREQNGVCTATTRDAELLAWIRGSGLTREEVVRIQEPGFTGRRLRRIDPAAVIAAHLRQVLAELEADADASLELAVERSLAPKA